VHDAIKIDNLKYTYRLSDKPALAGVDLAIKPAEFVVILGPSGAGKSTLCYTFNGLVPKFLRGELTGSVTLFGRSSSDQQVNALSEQVGLVFQDFESQLFSTNVELEVAFAPENFGVERAEIARRVQECLATVGLTGLERREPATLSGGQKQRLAIASVLSLQPSMIVMDEPTTDLDPLGKEGVFAVSRRLRAQGLTMVIAEHETEEAAVADRVVVLNEGRVVADGPPAEVLIRTDWLEQLGVQPLGAAQLTAHLGLPPALSVETATESLAGAGYRVDPGALASLERADAQRTAAATPEPVIEVRALQHRYPNGLVALHGADLVINRGEFVAMVGQNGSGKTTLIKHFNGLLMPSAGQVLVNGQPSAGQTVLELGRTVGYVFQNPDHQIFAETVFDEVAFGPRNHGASPDAVKLHVTEALAAVGLEGRETEDPFSLTKGERQRVAVASILATRPQVIILDEPTTGLDYKEQRNMMDLVRRLNEAGHTVICVTHTMWVVAEYAHRTVVVKDGRIWMDGPTRQVMAREAELTQASLKPPQLVRISNRLGGTLLTLAECTQAIRRG
jgi:energy-coupling factor transporter ATP-binding protein EcfA2